MEIRPRRSVLYMPGSNARALEKAKTLPADALILDLEDAVAPDQKHEARAQVVEAVKAGGYGNREITIRVNGFDTAWYRDDIKAAAIAGANAVLVPKVSTPGDIERAAGDLKAAGAPDGLNLWAMMETPLAMLNAADIARAGSQTSPRLTCFIMGTNDLAKDTRARLTPSREPMLAWLSTCIAAGRAYGIDIVDGVYNDFRNEAGFVAECAHGVDIGMDGKTLIHPGQVAPCNEAFSPSADEIEWARKIIAAFELPENSGKGAITVDGKMVELLHAEMARRTVAIADAIAQS